MNFRNIVSLWITMAVLLAATITQAQNRAAISGKMQPAGSSMQPSRETPPTPDGASPAYGSCAYSFSTGSGPGYLQFCITQNGNVYNFQSPAGVEMLSPQGSAPFEGYGICDPTTSTSYYDYNYTASNNWNPPTTLTSDATEVKIERVTIDGLWTLTQTFTLEKGPPPYVKVTMSLKNNTPETKTPAFLRYANFQPDTGGVENYDSTKNSTWGYTSYSDGALDGANEYGLMLQNASAPSPSSTSTFWFGVTQNTVFGPTPCEALAASSGTLTYTQGSGFLLYYPTLAKNQSVTITDEYFSF